MEKNKYTVKVGTKIIFHDTGGNIKHTSVNTEYTIVKLGNEFMAENKYCDATLNTGATVRLSDNCGNGDKYGYHDMFEIVGQQNNYPIW